MQSAYRTRTPNSIKLAAAMLLAACCLLLAPLTVYAKTSVTRKTVYLSKGYTQTLSVKGKNSSYKWKSKNKKNVTVSKSGVLKGKKKGKTQVTATRKSKKKKIKYIFTVIVEDPKLSQTTLKLERGASKKLSVSTEQKVTWSTSKSSVAKASGGIVRAIAPGTATITATVGGKKKLKCKVTVVLRDWAEDSNGDGLPDYWDPHARQKVNEIRANAAAVGDNGLQFLFVTDLHFPANRLLSVPLIWYIARNTGIRTVVNGGDVVDKSHTKQDALKCLALWNTYMSGMNVVNVRGNHDSNTYPEGRSSSLFISDQEYYSIMIAGKGYRVSDGNLYYYIDDASSRTRVIVLDTGSPAEPAYKYVMNQEQKEWLEGLLIREETDPSLPDEEEDPEEPEPAAVRVTSNVPDGWHVVILQHAFYDYRDRSSAKLGTYRFAETEMEILGRAKEAGVDIAGIFCGHSHRDYATVQNGFPVIATMCDAINKTKSYDPLHYDRKWGTPEEQAFDVVQIDYSARKIRLTRVGCGNNREFSF